LATWQARVLARADDPSSSSWLLAAYSALQVSVFRRDRYRNFSFGTVEVTTVTAMGFVGFFAILHGHAHGSGIPDNVGGVAYAAGWLLIRRELLSIPRYFVIGV
jgi:hypothetical protein